MWYEDRKKLRIKEDYIVAKLYNKDGSFFKAVTVPSEMYETVGTVKLFCKNNCKRIKDKIVLDIFDSIKYEPGKCFYFSSELCEKLRDNGYDAKLYAGWLFLDNNFLPTYHCWVVLDDSVLDLADHFTKNKEMFGCKNYTREEYANNFAKLLKLKNSERCYPVGLPYEELLYAGSETTAEKGMKLCKKILDKYPNHEAFNKTNADGKTLTQQMIDNNL